MERKESNRLILDFMGVKPTQYLGKSFCWSDSPHYFTSQDTFEQAMDSISNYAKYDKSWDWLKKVVDKCLHICHEEMLNEWENSFCDKFLAINIDPMYNEVVEFIKYYNSQIKNNSQ